MSSDQFFVVAGFAVSVAALALAVKGIGHRWLILIGLTAGAAFVSAGSLVLWENHQRSRHLETVSAKIIAVIGSGRRTTDEVLESLFPEDFGTVNESFGLLLREEKIQNVVIDTVDKAGLSHKIRVYFVKQ